MIIKSFLNKIRISKYFLILILLCFVTGLIKELSALIILIIFHEFGHYLISYIFKWNISRIDIYPFGGLIKFEEQIDKPLLEELLICISGPLNQFIIYLILLFIHSINLISDNYFNIIRNYHYSMFIFNLLPIIPLDGSKILNILLNYIFNYKLSYNLLLFISTIFLFLFIIIFKNNYSYFIIISFLIYESYIYIKNKRIYVKRFILEKYLYKNKYKKYLKINNINKMKRNRKHLIKNNNIYITEKEYIKKRSITPNMVYNKVHNMDMKDNNT